MEDVRLPPLPSTFRCRIYTRATNSIHEAAESAPDGFVPISLLCFSLSDHGMMGPGDFNFTDFNSYTTPSLATFPDNLGNLQPLQPSPQTVYSPTLPQQPGGFNGSSDQPGRARSASRRESDAGASASGRQMSYEDASRLVAEEDKRRRNTAASARFRIKKKQREQALEKSAKEMTDKVTSLEGRISQLETENKWLKNLIMEKNESGGEDIATMWQKQQVASTSASPTTESSEKKSGRHSSKESKSSSSGSSTMKKEN